MTSVLAGKCVIELGTMIAAPFAGHLLSQLGADVIKVEPPIGDSTRQMMRGGPSGTFIAYSRGKRSVCIDLKTPEGQSVLQKLIAKADIVIHNLAPLAAQRLKLTFDDCDRLNPHIIHCHISGYGAGPRESELASNPVIEANTGVMYSNRVEGRPTRLGPSYHDQFSGCYAVIGILAALGAKNPDRLTRKVELGLYETGLHVAARDLVGAQLKTQLGVKSRPNSGGEFSMPGYGAYETADGRWIFILMLTDTHWQKFCVALAIHEGQDAELATMRQRKLQRPRVENIVKSAVKAVDYHALSECLYRAGVGCTEVTSTETTLNDPQAQVHGKLAQLPFGGLEFNLPNMPLPNQLAIDEDERSPPLLGEHTVEVLQKIGFTSLECTQLIEQQVVCIPQKPATRDALWAPVKK